MEKKEEGEAQRVNPGKDKGEYCHPQEKVEGGKARSLSARNPLPESPLSQTKKGRRGEEKKRGKKTTLGQRGHWLKKNAASRGSSHY